MRRGSTGSARRVHRHLDPPTDFLEEQQGCPTSQNYNVTQGSGSEAGNGIGYNFWSSCIGVYRSFYSFDTSASSSAWKVISAQMSVPQTYSSDLGCSDSWPITAYNLGKGTTFGSGSDWSNYQPTQSSSNEVASDSIKVGEPSCADHTATFNVASEMQSGATGNNADWSFSFRPPPPPPLLPSPRRHHVHVPAVLPRSHPTAPPSRPHSRHPYRGVGTDQRTAHRRSAPSSPRRLPRDVGASSASGRRPAWPSDHAAERYAVTADRQGRSAPRCRWRQLPVVPSHRRRT